MSWKTLGAALDCQISRICGVYQITDNRIPGTRLRIEVLESGRDGGFLAMPNMCFYASGAPDWTSGMGRTEEEALSDLLEYFLGELDRRGAVDEDEVEWAESRDF
jgi:hypothetical protein